jgi:hypothetical protein
MLVMDEQEFFLPPALQEQAQYERALAAELEAQLKVTQQPAAEHTQSSAAAAPRRRGYLNDIPLTSPPEHGGLLSQRMATHTPRLSR